MAHHLTIITARNVRDVKTNESANSAQDGFFLWGKTVLAYKTVPIGNSRGTVGIEPTEIHKMVSRVSPGWGEEVEALGPKIGWHEFGKTTLEFECMFFGHPPPSAMTLGSQTLHPRHQCQNSDSGCKNRACVWYTQTGTTNEHC